MVEITLANTVVSEADSNKKKMEQFHILFYQSFFSMLGISKIETISPNDLIWFYMYYQMFIFDLLELCGIERNNLDNIFVENIKVTNKECFNFYNNIIDLVKKAKGIE